MERIVNNIYTFSDRLESCEIDYITKVQEKLKGYEDLEEQGLLLKLPCKIGHELYDIIEFVEDYHHPEMYVISTNVIEIRRDESGLIYCIDGMDYRQSDFGRTLFTSENEAWDKVGELYG